MDGQIHAAEFDGASGRKLCICGSHLHEELNLDLTWIGRNRSIAYGSEAFKV